MSEVGGKGKRAKNNFSKKIKYCPPPGGLHIKGAEMGKITFEKR